MPGLLLPTSLQAQISKELNQNLYDSSPSPLPPILKKQEGNLCLKKKISVPGNSLTTGEGVISTSVCYYLCYFLLESTARFLLCAPGEEQAGQSRAAPTDQGCQCPTPHTPGFVTPNTSKDGSFHYSSYLSFTRQPR